MSETIKDIETVETVEKTVDTVDNVKVEEEKKPYELKKLDAENVFPMVTIINKIGFKEFKTLFDGDGLKNIVSGSLQKDEEGKVIIDDTVISSIGKTIIFDIIGVVLENLPKCENDIFKFLSQISNLSEKEVRELALADFTEMIFDFFKKEEFKDFIKVVSKFVK